MRRVFLLIAIIICGSVTFAEAINRPKWEDYSPAGLRNANYREIQWYWPVETKATQETYNYWAKRRKEFHEELQ